jgi:alkylation response protein AidB-like acyl-CoA dehydrogenase
LNNPEETLQALETLAESFATNVIERQKRRHLEPEDFEHLADAGFLLTGVPVDQGGFWQGPADSARLYSRMVRTIAHGDPSVALVAAMHPAVMGFFLGVEAVDDAPDAWKEQRQMLIELGRTNWWGTVTSEPGSGGDILKTRTSAVPGEEGEYLITGEKHFGSGSGHADFMITTGRVTGAEVPDLFYITHKDAPWDGSTGCEMTASWDGMGMSATQSHAFRFTDFPATKIVSSEVLARVAPITSQMSNMMFTAVILGVADNALRFAKGKLEGRVSSMRSFERVEWTRCQNELWLAEQAYEGALRAIEAGGEDSQVAALRCKITCAELIEAALSRMAKVVGGASYSKAMPLAQWTEDVKALGFLRPPLPLAYDQLLG